MLYYSAIFARMIARRILPELGRRVELFPAVALLGPRQAGKTTLALELARKRNSLYLDLESEADLAKLSEPELFLSRYFDRLVVLDEIHRLPRLFPVLRSLIDRARRSGHRAGLYLLLGSASLELLARTGESLAGRISYMELAPFDVLEVAPKGGADADRLWLRGGFPESFLAPDDPASYRWRLDFIRTYLERELPLFNTRLPAAALRRFWTMLAHLQGEELNQRRLGESLDLNSRTVRRYLDLMSDLYLLRFLPPWRSNVGKRLTKRPRVFFRDSGLVHALLGLETSDQLFGHPVVGKSWEGFVIEQLLVVGGDRVQGSYYRTAGGAEVDLLLEFSRGEVWQIEAKRSLNPKPSRGFFEAARVLKPQRKLVVYPGDATFPLAEDTWAIPLAELAAQVQENTSQT